MAWIDIKYRFAANGVEAPSEYTCVIILPTDIKVQVKINSSHYQLIFRMKFIQNDV